MKRSLFKSRFALTVVLCLAILASTLMSVVPVSAANPVQPNADWPLTLQAYSTGGALLRTVTLTQAQFEAMVTAAYPANENEANKWEIPSNYHDGTSAGTGIYEKGLAFWRLVSLIDDNDPASFNNSLYGTYSVRITGQNLDGSTYPKTFNPSSGAYAGFAFGGSNENIFVANKIQYSNYPGEYMITNGGSGYTATPIVTITPAAGDTTGSGATAVAVLTAGVVTNIDVVAKGSGYTATPIVTITPAAGDTTGSGAIAISTTVTGNSDWYDMPYYSATNLGKLFYPTVMCGSGISSSGNRIGGTIKIELLNLPRSGIGQHFTFQHNSG